MIRRPPSRSLSTLPLTLGLLVAACGGSAPPPVVVTPFTAEHEPLFENGVDMVTEPDTLGGSWLETWEHELDRRITFSDLVALVTISTLRTDTDLDRRDTYRLVARPDRVFLGEEALGDEEEALVLSVREGEGGYGTVQTNERRLLDAQFFAFVKWERDEAGALRPRWHLSPATDTVARRVRDLLARRREISRDDSGGTRRIIVHRN